MASWFDKVQGKKGLASLFPGKGGTNVFPPKPLPGGHPGFYWHDSCQKPPTLRPPIEEPGGPTALEIFFKDSKKHRDISLAALKRKRQQLRELLPITGDRVVSLLKLKYEV